MYVKVYEVGLIPTELSSLLCGIHLESKEKKHLITNAACVSKALFLQLIVDFGNVSHLTEPILKSQNQQHLVINICLTHLWCAHLRMEMRRYAKRNRGNCTTYNRPCFIAQAAELSICKILLWKLAAHHLFIIDQAAFHILNFQKECDNLDERINYPVC